MKEKKNNFHFSDLHIINNSTNIQTTHRKPVLNMSEKKEILEKHTQKITKGWENELE